MADPFDFLQNGPSLADMVAAQRQANAASAPQSNTTGNLVTSALSAGTHEALGSGASFFRAIGQAIGDTKEAQGAQNVAASQAAAAKAAGRTDLDEHPWSPSGMAYQVIKGLPTLGAGLAGAAALAPVIPEAAGAGVAGLLGRLGLNVGADAARTGLGAAAAMYPLSVGENVSASDDAGDAFTRGQALKALGLGVPEAAVGAIMPGRLEEILAHGAEGSIGKRIAVGAGVTGAYQTGVGAVTSALTQAMGDPNRDWAGYAHNIVDGALRGGLQGAVFGGAVHGLASKPIPDVLDGLPQATDDLLQLTGPKAPDQLPAPGPAGQLALPKPTLPDVMTPPAPTPDVINAPDQSVAREFQQMPDAQLNGLAQSLQRNGQDPDRLKNVMAEIATRTGSDQPQKLIEYQPQIGGTQDAIPLGDQTDGAHAAADEALAAQPKQIEAPSNAGLGSQEAIPLSDRTAPEAPAPMTAEAMSDRIKSVSPGKQVPGFLKGLDETQAKSALRDEINQRDQENTPIGKRLEAIGKELGVLDDKGQVVEEKAPEPVEDPVKAEADLNAPDRDSVPEQHQGKFDRLDDLRQKLLGDNLSHMGDERTELLGQIDDLQRSLQDPKGRGFAQQIAKATRMIGARMDDAGTERDLAADRGVEPTPSPVTPPPSLTDVSQPSPAAQAVIARAVPKADPMDTLKGRYVTAAKALTNLFQQGKLQEGLPNADKSQAAFQGELNRQSDQLQKVQQMIKANDAKGLAKVGDDFFSKKSAPSGPKSGLPEGQGGHTDPLLDDHFNSATPATQDLINKHADAMDALVQAVKPVAAKGIPAFGKRPSTLAPVEFQQQADLGHIMDRTGSGRSMLEYIADNGSTGWKKNLAQDMLARSADPSMRFNPDQTLTRSDYNPMRKNAADYVEGSNFSHINIFDRGADLERLTLHEMAHANSLRAFNAGGPAAKGMTDLFNRAKEIASPEEKGLYGLKNVHEFMAESHSNDAFRGWLRSQGDKGLSLWDRFKNATFKLLGAEGKMKTLYDRVLEQGNKVMAENENTRYTPMQLDQQLHAMGDTFERYRANAGEALKKDAESGYKSLGTRARSIFLPWRATDAILDDNKKTLPSGPKLVDLRSQRSARQDSYARFAGAAILAERHLPEVERNKLNQLRFASVIGVDPRKTVAQHTWLANKPGDSKETMADKAASRAQVDTYRRMYNGAAPETRAVHEQQRAVNQTQWYQKATHQLYTTLKNEVPSSPIADAFNAYQPRFELHDDPAGSEKWWKNAMDKTQGMVATAARGLDTTIADKTATPEAVKTAKDARESLASALKAYDTVVRQAGQAPNFSVQRKGDYYAAAKLAVDPKTGRVKAGAIDAAQKMLDADGFGDVRMIQGSSSTSVYARVEGQSQVDQLHGTFQKLADAGHFEQASVHSGAAEVASLLNKIAPKHLQRTIEAAKQQMNALNLTPEDKAAWEQGFTRQMLDMNPADTMQKFTQNREGVHGADANTAAAFQQRALAEGRGIAQMSMEKDIGAAQTAMHDEMKALNASGPGAYRKTAAAQVLNEVTRREAQKQWNYPNGFAGALRSMTHTLEVGASFKYPFTLASQIATLSLPRLGSVHGYVKSADALARSGGEAVKVMRAAFAGKYTSTFGLGYEALKAAGLSDERARFHMDQQARAVYNTSAATAALTKGHADPHTTLGKWVGYANLMGLYSEMFPRVLTSIAADKLWKENPNSRPAKDVNAAAHAARMTDKSQLNFDTANTPRQLTQGGSFGPASPLMNQFMRFRGNITELLYRETHEMFAGETQADKVQARKFMLGHLAAVTTIAGTLGMPMFAGLAGLYDKIANEVSGADNTDIRASYRHFLAETFGKGTGEVLARGLPRALGMDFSDLGEDRLLPGTQWLTEKRKFEDSERDWLKSMAGSGVNTVANYALGFRDLQNGDFLLGAEKMLPDAMRGLAEAGRAVTHGGFQDKYGFDKPNVPTSTWNVMQTALGLDPGEEANYDERNRVWQGQQALAQEHSSNIVRHIIQAQNQGNSGNLAAWIGENSNFVGEHPGVQNPMRTMSSVYSERAKANATLMPQGLNPKNINAAQITDF